MSVHLHFLLILTGLTGINSITTVSKVSVKAGASISIPCLYDSQYINHVKYLCEGSVWNFCSYAVKTNRQKSGKFSISDDKSQRIFTVTIKDLTDKDTYYWCAVEIDGGSDVKERFQLSVTRGTPSLYVDQQEITGFKGDNITISCNARNSGDFKWCRLGGSCVTGTSVSFYGTRVTIIRKIPIGLTVTMSGVSTESSGWYLCVKGDLQMPVHLTVEEQPTTRINSITTVSKVSVKAGASISIPCLYDPRYINHVKYLCEGLHLSPCSNAVKTNQENSAKFSISDDKSQRIFTVTIKDVTNKDTDYWCAVEIDEEPDVRQYFQLSVTRGTPSLYVDQQEITGFIGDNIIISCSYNSEETKWCRLGGSCVTGTSVSFSGTRLTIIRKIPIGLIVTMSGVSTESSGWYLCVKGDLQMPVHLTVEEQPTTNAPPTTVQHNESVSADLKPFIIPLGLLIFVVMVTLFILFMLKRHKQTKAESSATATAEEEVTYSVVKIKSKTPAQAEEEVTYSDVKHKKKTPVESSDAKSDVDVTYSSVVIVGQQTVEKVEAKDEDVTYSSLAQQQQNL